MLIKPNNLKELLHQKRIKPIELAKAIGKSKQSVYEFLEHKTNMRYSTVQKIITFLNCTEEELFGTGIPTINKEDSVESDAVLNKLYIPMYDVKASAGSGIINFNEDIKMEIAFDLFTSLTGIKVSANEIKNGKYAFITVKGDSMSPLIEDGSIVLINHHDKELSEAKRVFVFTDGSGQLYIKEISLSPMKKINIVSYNKDYESWYKLSNEELIDIFGNINIKGKVISQLSRTTYLKNMQSN